MKKSFRLPVIILLVTLGGLLCLAAELHQTAGRPIHLLGRDYFLRWSQGSQYEFTPDDQKDLEHWSDMITLNYYGNVKDGEALAASANAVIENYTAHQGLVLNTDSVPRTDTRPAEHFCAVVFPRPDFIEAVFARFELSRGSGLSAVYSHREYGKEIGPRMSTWLSGNGPAAQKALMALDPLPAADDNKK